MPHQRRTVSRILRMIWRSSSRAESIGIPLPQLLLQRCVTLFGDVLDRSGAVDRYHRCESTDEPIVLAFDGLQLQGRLVALELRAPLADPVEGDVDRHVEEEREIGLARE